MSGSASAIYMCFGSVAGEAQAPANSRKAPASGGWMELLSCNFAGSLNYGSRAADTVENQSDASPVTISKVTDASSPGLLRQAILGAFDNQAVIVFLRTGPAGDQVEFLRLELQDCGITSFGIEGGGTERAVESFTIRYAAMEVKSYTFDAAGQRNQVSYVVKNQS